MTPPLFLSPFPDLHRHRHLLRAPRLPQHALWRQRLLPRQRLRQRRRDLGPRRRGVRLRGEPPAPPRAWRAVAADGGPVRVEGAGEEGVLEEEVLLARRREQVRGQQQVGHEDELHQGRVQNRPEEAVTRTTCKMNFVRMCARA